MEYIETRNKSLKSEMRCVSNLTYSNNRYLFSMSINSSLKGRRGVSNILLFFRRVDVRIWNRIDQFEIVGLLVLLDEIQVNYFTKPQSYEFSLCKTKIYTGCID